MSIGHDDVIKWKHFPRYWPFVWGIHRSPVNSPHKGQWRGALMFSLICAWINGWVNNREAGDLRCYRAHYDAIVMGFVQRNCRNKALHYNDVIWASWRLKSPAFRLFFQRLLQANIKGNIKVPPHWSFMMGIYLWQSTGDRWIPPHEGLVIITMMS